MGSVDLKPVTMRRLALRNVRAKPSRFIATILAILVGTGFLSAALVLQSSVSSSLENNAVAMIANVDAAVEPKQPDIPGGRSTGLESSVPLTLLPTVQAVAGVAGASGVATGDIGILDSTGTPIGGNATGRLWITVPQLNPFTVVSGQAPAAQGQIAVDQQTVEKANLQVGQQVALKTTTGRQNATIVGITTFGDEPSASSTGDVFVSQADLATYLQAGDAHYDQIYVAAQPGQQSAVTAAVQQAVGPNYNVLSGQQLKDAQIDSTAGIAQGIGVGLQAFAWLALFVCALIVYNTFSIIVAQRQREFALLRAVGTSTKQVRKAVRSEALVVGFVASALGLLLGIGAFAILLKAVPAFKDLTAGGAVRLRLTLGTVLVVMIFGMLITFVSAFFPAWRAGRVKPIAALQDVAIDRSGSNKFRMVVGPIIIAIGAALLVLGVAVGQFLVGIIGPALLFVGVLIGGPRLALWFTSAVGFLLSPIKRRVVTLAVQNTRRNPSRTATTANALVIGVFLVVFVTTAGGAIRDYAADQVSNFGGPALTVSASGSSLPTNLPQQIQAIPGVTGTATVYSVVGTMPYEGGGGPGGNGTTVVGAVDYSNIGVIGYQVGQGSLDDLGPNEVVMWNLFAQGLNARIGTPLTITLTNGTTINATVGAIVQPLFGAPPLTMSAATAVAADPNLQPDSMAIQTEPGATQDVQAAIEKLIVDYTNVEVYPGDIFGQVIKSVFTALIQSVNALLGVAVIIALFGIVNTLILSVTERTREIGVLRAVGMSRRQLRTVIRIEAVIVALLGTIIGMVFGVFVAYFATRPIFSEGNAGAFPWPVTSLALIALLGVVLGVLASLVPAWRAARLNVLEAIKVE